MQGLEHLFSGLVSGVGQATTDLAKQKADREDKDKQLQLNTLINLLQLPGMKPEDKTQLFKQALDVASGGNKKVVDGMHGILGPLLHQHTATQNGDGQTGGVRPSSVDGGGSQTGTPADTPQTPGGIAQAGLPPSGMSKFGSGQSAGSFFSPEEETQQAASRAGAIAGATQTATLQATEPFDKAKHERDIKDEIAKETRNGNELMGFGKPDAVTGMVTPLYFNHITRQAIYGAPVDPFTSLQVMQELEAHKAIATQAREEGVKNILLGWNTSPETATPEQKKKAQEAYGRTQSEGPMLENELKRSGAFHNYAIGAAAMDKDAEKGAITENQRNIDYARQEGTYMREGNDIGAAIKQFDIAKDAASKKYDEAMALKNYLETQYSTQKDYGRHLTPPELNADDKAKGLTWVNYDALIAQAQADLTAAGNLARSANSTFKGKVEIGYSGDWPYIKDIRKPFEYVEHHGLPDMPTKGGGKKKSATINVSAEQMKKLGLGP